MNHQEPIIKNKEWIGRIPSDWDFVKVKEHFIERNTKVDDMSFPPLSVSMGGVVDQMENVSKSDNSENRKLVKKNDFVINSRSDRKGSSGISPRDGSVSLINIVLKPKNINPKYSEYLFKSYYFKEEFFRNGKGIHFDLWSTRYELMKQIFIPYPKIEEQNKIVEYLDNKTHQIDKLTKKIGQKTKLLKEQRTSLINEVVTKGLDPNVEMKDSGIEFIGKIPSHWIKTSVRNLIGKGSIKIQDGNHGELHPKSDDYQEEGIPFVMSNNLRNGEVDYESCNKLNKELTDQLRIGFSFEGDVLLTHKGTIGRVSIVSDLKSPYIMLTPQVTFYRCLNQDLINKYLFYQFQSNLFQTQMDILSSDGSTRKYIGVIDQKSLPILLIPTLEQRQIIDYLDKHTKIIDENISRETQRVELLKEYKQSLISEVVTGKKRIFV